MNPGYASPEQISGDPAGKRGDIYSLAVVLYKLRPAIFPYATRRAQIWRRSFGQGAGASEQGF